MAWNGSLVVFSAVALEDIGMVLGLIIIFGVGSMIGMALVGSLMRVPFAFAQRITSMQKIFKYTAGVFSLAIGINIMYQIGILGHLLSI